MQLKGKISLTVIHSKRRRCANTNIIFQTRLQEIGLCNVTPALALLIDHSLSFLDELNAAAYRKETDRAEFQQKTMVLAQNVLHCCITGTVVVL